MQASNRARSSRLMDGKSHHFTSLKTSSVETRRQPEKLIIENIIEPVDSDLFGKCGEWIDNTADDSKQQGKESGTEKAAAQKSKLKARHSGVSTRDLDAIQLYLKEIEFSPLLTPEEEVKYGRLARQGDSLGRKKMIVCNLRLVVKISRRYMNRGLPLPDLIEEGNLGLIHAVEKFDPERGFRFSTYATWWIRQNIERALMNQTRTIRLPIHINKELNQYYRKMRELTQKYGVEPDLPEVAKALGKPVEKLQKLLNYSERVSSLDITIGSENSNTLVNFISEKDEQTPDEAINDEVVHDSVDSWLNQLEPKQQEVIVRRFGLHGHDNSTLAQVGEELGLTRERVRQIQMDALRRLRRILENQGYSGDMLFGEE